MLHFDDVCTHSSGIKAPDSQLSIMPLLSQPEKIKRFRVSMRLRFPEVVFSTLGLASQRRFGQDERSSPTFSKRAFSFAEKSMDVESNLLAALRIFTAEPNVLVSQLKSICRQTQHINYATFWFRRITIRP
uniref:Uncharacterized protein n=1 Tax=Grammatophora oceanica TaxID=210454 RepID=A0A7S1VET4_9STRA|mmetsp:Transcript_43402/g.64345  ORF Transcript_43402/g.64345 Transcript_43402/m.64345 type:complete len:131 (+) Transcript_43402:142-534(+)